MPLPSVVTPTRYRRCVLPATGLVLTKAAPFKVWLFKEHWVAVGMVTLKVNKLVPSKLGATAP